MMLRIIKLLPVLVANASVPTRKLAVLVAAEAAPKLQLKEVL